ncbi:MAG: alpha-ketoacid dehydrogenase subunit beta, partial [Anaerolineales bacterium]|nr:alpha-ketoacid dehydrogenase subunit beta [Anaerolineales bacterium]
MPELSMLQAIRLALVESLEGDDRVVLLGADIGRLGGIFRATEGLLERFGPDRIVDTPLSISAGVGAAIGLALYGLRPVYEVQFADFIHPAFNQIVNEAARICYRSNGDWTVPLVIRAPFGGGAGGGLYHSQSVEAFFSHVPGLKVVIPSSPGDARSLLKAAIKDPNPVVFLEPRTGYQELVESVPENSNPVAIGRALVSRVGDDLTLVTYGMMHGHAWKAAELLHEEGIDAEIIDLRTLAPFDRESVLASVRKTGKALIVHEDNLTGGFGAEISAVIADEAFGDLDGPVKRLAGPDVPGVPFSQPLEEWFLITPEKIA